MDKVRIVWNGQGGELDSTVTDDDGHHSVRDALIALMDDGIVSAGDSFVIERID